MAGTGGTDFAHDNSNNAANITEAIPRVIKYRHDIMPVQWCIDGEAGFRAAFGGVVVHLFVRLQKIFFF
jgi:hypothetical protein